MTRFNGIAIKGAVLAAALATAVAMPPARAHSSLDLSVPVQLLLLNSVLNHGHDHYYREIRKQTRHGVRQHPGYGRDRLKPHAHGPARHSHSREGYRYKGHSRHRY